MKPETPNKETYTLRCMFCDHTEQITVDPAAMERWQNGQVIQKAFPDLSIGTRELMISKMCSDCFDAAVPDE